MIQIFYGDGKGKTTAAVGGVVRAAGHGLRVLFTQFFKNGDSGEIFPLRAMENIFCSYPQVSYALFEQVSETRRAEISAGYSAFIKEIAGRAPAWDMIVLDEVLDAYAHAYMERESLIHLLQTVPAHTELVLTGHVLPQDLLPLADYISEVRAVKHPYKNGQPARKGIEF